MTIVGVTEDAAYHEEGERAEPYLFTPWLQGDSRAEPISILVRMDGDASSVAGAVRQIVRRRDASLPLYDVTTIGDAVRERQGPRHAASVVLSLFGGLALVIASIGLYGVMAFAVAQRTREIGIRLALGATATVVIRQVLGEGLRLVVVGVLAGALLSAAATRVLAGALVGISPLDPPAYAGAIAVLGGAALVACYLPARRATRVDPVQTLRAE